MLRPCLLTLMSLLLLTQAHAGSIRGTAVVDLGFNEKAGPAVDTASGGQANNSGRLLAGARRVPSPFATSRGGRAVLLEAARKQFIQVPSTPDTSRPQAVSIAMLLVSFHGPADAGLHGLFAKRASDKTARSNYGLNFQPKGNLLQLYVNDGSGFRVVRYSANSVIGSRQRVHLVASLAVGDAPGADADTDSDDVRVRLFVNGQPATRIGKPDRDLAEGTDIWLLNVKTDMLQNSAPLTLGASSPAAEHFSGVIDEVQLFDRELNAQEAAGLFVEVEQLDLVDDSAEVLGGVIDEVQLFEQTRTRDSPGTSSPPPDCPPSRNSPESRSEDSRSDRPPAWNSPARTSHPTPCCWLR